jgi:metalloendopeptidase OMA1, mitochondrial
MIPRIARVVQPLRTLPRPSIRASKVSLPARTAQYQRWYYGSRYQRFQQTRGFFQRWAARPTFFYEVGSLGAAAGGFYIYNLETVPVCAL